MLAIVVLAAGRGTRMKSTTPKVLHTVAGRSMVQIVLAETAKLSPAQQVVVLSPELSQHPLDGITKVIQDTPLGSGHAVLSALDALASTITDVIICCGDTPLITAESLASLNTLTADVALIGMEIRDAVETAPYGRFVCDDAGRLIQIVEVKDATPSQKQIRIANSGVYKIKVSALKQLLPLIKNTNAAGEYYLTDIVHLAYQHGLTTDFCVGAMEDFAGVNNRAELAYVTHIYQERLRQTHMLNGVTMLAPETIVLHHDTSLKKDVTIHPFVTFGPGVVIESNAVVYGHCHLENCHIKSAATVGPFAHLRGGVIMDEKSSIGNFVEVKGSHFKTGAKAKHLSYIGDATVGVKANIGAGVITCNYNGFQKSKTTIGDGAFIGSNTALVAPVTVGDGAIVGAGSTIVNDVANNSLALTRPEQLEKSDWAITFRAKYTK